MGKETATLRRRIESLASSAERLRPVVEDCARRVERIRALQASKTKLEFALTNPHYAATTSDEPLVQGELERELGTIQAEIDELYSPMPAAITPVRELMQDLWRVLRDCPANTAGLKEVLGELRDSDQLQAASGRGAISLRDMREALDFLVLRLSQLLRFLPADSAPAVQPLSLPEGTAWDQVEIRFLDEYRVQVFARGRPYAPVAFTEAGFADKRGKPPYRPNSAWALLRQFAEGNGSVPRPPAGTAGLVRAEKAVQTLRRRVEALLGLPGDSLVLEKDTMAWRTTFRITQVGSNRL